MAPTAGRATPSWPSPPVLVRVSGRSLPRVRSPSPVRESQLTHLRSRDRVAPHLYSEEVQRAPPGGPRWLGGEEVPGGEQGGQAQEGRQGACGRDSYADERAVGVHRSELILCREFAFLVFVVPVSEAPESWYVTVVCAARISLNVSRAKAPAENLVAGGSRFPPGELRDPLLPFPPTTSIPVRPAPSSSPRSHTDVVLFTQCLSHSPRLSPRTSAVAPSRPPPLPSSRSLFSELQVSPSVQARIANGVQRLEGRRSRRGGAARQKPGASSIFVRREDAMPGDYSRKRSRARRKS